MSLGHRFNPRNSLWPLAVCLLALWGGGFWYWGGPHHSSSARTFTARAMLAELIMTYDDARHHPEQPAWQRWLAISDGSHRVQALDHGLQVDHLMTDALAVDLALAYHHFAKDSHNSPRWNALADRALAGVHDKERGSYYYYSVEALLHSRPLTPEQRTGLAALCAKYPTDWWAVQLAHEFGMDNQVSREALATRERRAGWQNVTYLVMGGTMILAGLILAWPLWRIWHRSKSLMGPRPCDHRRHLRRLWSAAPTLVCFCLAGGVYMAFGLAANLPAIWIADSFFSPTSSAHWWIVIITWMLFSIASLLSLPLALSWCMAPELGNLRQVFDLRRSDLTNWRWWFIGIAGSTLILDSSVLLGYFSMWLGVPGNTSDHLSRTFVQLGELSLPFSILYGAILAPFMEEIVFRGFLFTASGTSSESPGPPSSPASSSPLRISTAWSAPSLSFSMACSSA